MALRCICFKLPQCNLFRTVSKVRVLCKNNGYVRHSSSSAMDPSVPFLESPSVVFSVDALNHHWGAWPVVLISAFGLVCELMAIARLAATRDDLWYTKSSAACDVLETRKGYPAPCRKLLVLNQKYETPRELIAALRDDVDGPPCDICKDDNDGKNNSINRKIIAAHVIASLGVIYMAFFI